LAGVHLLPAWAKFYVQCAHVSHTLLNHRSMEILLWNEIRMITKKHRYGRIYGPRFFLCWKLRLDHSNHSVGIWTPFTKHCFIAFYWDREDVWSKEWSKEEGGVLNSNCKTPIWPVPRLH
jgi:hypothetical protein